MSAAITRKGLEALAEGIAEGCARLDIDEARAVALGTYITVALRHAGQVTPHFDPARFEDAVRAGFRERRYGKVGA